MMKFSGPLSCSFTSSMTPARRLRLLGIRCSELTSAEVQMSMFENKVQKLHLYNAIDDVKIRYGKDALGKAGSDKF